MSLLEEYPRTNRKNTRELQTVLARVPGLGEPQKEEYAASISDIADLACDLEDVVQRLLRGPGVEELADLLTAFELTLEQIRGHSDFVDGKLYEMADRLRGEQPAEATPDRVPSGAETEEVRP